jgi:CRP/FNR family transcriptional regulator
VDLIPVLQREIVERAPVEEILWPKRPDRRGGSPAPDTTRQRETVCSCQAQAFGTLSRTERMWLAQRAALVSYTQGRVFYRPDDPSENVFVLRQGKVARYRITPEGRKLVVARLEAPAIFGGMGAFDQGMYGCFAEAATDCVLCVLSRRDFQSLVRRNPDVGLNLLADLGRRLQQREAELESLAFDALPTRLAALLLAEADGCGAVVGLSHQDLADRLATYRETVSQVLGRFRHEGLIAIGPRRIRILDRAGLATYAQS